MRRLVLLAALTATVGCGDKSPPSPPAPKPADPNIRVKDSYNGGAGPLNGGRSREYEGPVSQAPDWAKTPPPKAK